ncbi:MAG: hypothetical protein GY777_29945 [Candidatus Brocadiaceae bacterium]|nr:hypothetical protein [Candidatus Brocadiaceae bacterium]
MTQLGTPIPKEIKNIRKSLEKHLRSNKLITIDANSHIKGKDFLHKIWEMILSVPIGIAIISKELTPYTLANIFYEIGLLQAYGKETLVIKTKDSYVPSDFIRTEYIEYDRNFKKKITKYLDGLIEQSEYYANTSKLLEGNPLLSIDYLHRAFLLSGNEKYKKEARMLSETYPFDKQTKFGIDSFLRA